MKKSEEEKTAERRRKREAQMERHLVVCPHCGEKTLDHLTKCHKCGGELTPRGYKPLRKQTETALKVVGWIIGIAALAAVLVAFILQAQ